MDHQEHCELLATEVERFAAVVGDLPATTAVPTCPGWDVSELSRHLGGVHRWAEDLVRSAATRRRPRQDVVSGGPGLAGPTWILEGGAMLLGTLRAADPDREMWAWGADQHVRFWSRRMLHETVVHRVDAELAGALEPSIDPAVAADGIDELLVNLPPRISVREPDASALRGHGEVIAVRPDDAGHQSHGWGITLGPERISVGPDPAQADAAYGGPAAGLLLVLYRRRAPDAAGVRVEGDAALAHRWLDHTAI